MSNERDQSARPARPDPPTRAAGDRPTRQTDEPRAERRDPSRYPDHERYEFREVIGQGGQRIVFRVFDAELDRDVALKTLLPGDDDVELASLESAAPSRNCN